MKKLSVVLVFSVLLVSGIFGQQKFALVIGNGNYAGISKLNNPINDANDMAAALQSLGFTVDKLLNGTLDQMESAAIRLKNRLSSSQNSYGFFFYAGHGVQAGGENYLIPVDASIQSENFLRTKALSVQLVLDELNESGNELNVVVLDACRDNPFGWGRSGLRGLSMVSRQPTGSIVVYATSAGKTAADGTGRNGLFTGHLLNNLKTSGLEIKEIFNRTGADVMRASSSAQVPGVYNQFFGSAYLNGRPATVNVVPVQPPAPQPAPTSTAKAHYERGELFRNREDWDMAIMEYTAAIRLDPNYKEAYNNRGYSYDEKGDYDRAITDYTQAIRLDPNYKQAYYSRGNAYYSKKDYDRAIADYTQAIRLDPNYKEAYYSRGDSYDEKGEYDRAIADYTQAIRLDPNYKEAYNNRGYSYNEKGDYDRAIADFTQAIRIDPNYALAYNNRGVVYENKDEYDRAIADYTQAIRLDPNDANAYNNRGDAYKKKGDTAKANADYAKAWELGYEP